jgi:hypothetical protein
VQATHRKQCVYIRKGMINPKFMVPHRSHDPHCSHNKDTKGFSEMTVYVQRTAASHIARNTAPIGRIPVEDAQFRQTWGSVSTYFSPSAVEAAPLTTPPEYDSIELIVLQPGSRGVEFLETLRQRPIFEKLYKIEWMPTKPREICRSSRNEVLHQ